MDLPCVSMRATRCRMEKSGCFHCDLRMVCAYQGAGGGGGSVTIAREQRAVAETCLSRVHVLI